MTAGEPAVYTMRLRRRARHSFRRGELTITNPLPEGVTAHFVSSRRRLPNRPNVVLTLATSSATPAGTYRLPIRVRRGRRTRATSITLIVLAPGDSRPPASVPGEIVPDAFRIDGELPAPLTPGGGQVLDLRLSNTGTSDLTIEDLAVSVASVSAPASAPARPCSPIDFSVTQFSGSYGFVLSASSTRSLSELGISAAQQPNVAMLNTSLNQDGCKGARLTLAFNGSATGGGS